MKNTLLAFAFLFGTTLATAQPQFAQLGAKWYYHDQGCQIFGNGEPWDQYNVREVHEDTIIDGKYCTKLSPRYITSLSSCLWEYYVYQEGSKVYVYNGDIARFQVLYDFSLKAGDSYGLRVCEDTWHTDSILLTVESATEGPNGVQRIVITPGQNGTNWNNQIIEVGNGVGSLGDEPVFRPSFSITFEDPCYQSTLLCYETPDAGVVHINGNSCVSGTSPTLAEDSGTFIVLSPNPASEEITIQCKAALSQPIEVELFASTGQLVATWSLAKGQQLVQCSLSHVTPGLYSWKAKANGQHLDNGKLVIFRQ